MKKTANYTITIHRLEQNHFDFGLNDYPIFNEEYRPILNDAILSYYRFYEIGFKNPIEFRERLRQRMNLIMRYKYNELYKVREKEFNPLYNIEIIEEMHRETSGTTTGSSSDKGENSSSYNGESTSSSENNNTNSSNVSRTGISSTGAFPTEKMLEGDLSSGLYADSASNVKNSETSSGSDTQKGKQTASGKDTETGKSSSSSSSSGTSNNTEDYTHTTKGSSAGLPFSKAMLQFKEFITAYHLDEQVIGELKDLFMSVY